MPLHVIALIQDGMATRKDTLDLDFLNWRFQFDLRSTQIHTEIKFMKEDGSYVSLLISHKMLALFQKYMSLSCE